MKFPSSSHALASVSRVGPRGRRRSVIAPLRSFASASACVGAAHRGRRHPAGAHGGAVCASLRLPAVLGLGSRRTTRFVRCAHCARTGAASQSTKRACAPTPAWPCRPRRARRPGRSQGTNGPLDRLCPCSPPRRPTNRPCRVPPAAKTTRGGAPARTTTAAAKARPGRWQRACGAPRSTGLVARARSAPRNLTCRTLSERSERSERSELCDGPQGRAPQGSRCAAPTAPPKRCRLPGRDFAARLSAGRASAFFGDRSRASDCTDAAPHASRIGIERHVAGPLRWRCNWTRSRSACTDAC